MYAFSSTDEGQCCCNFGLLMGNELNNGSTTGPEKEGTGKIKGRGNRGKGIIYLFMLKKNKAIKLFK